MDRCPPAVPRACSSSRLSPCRNRTGLRLPWCPTAPACGACSPASSAPASSSARYCLSSLFFPDGRIDDPAVEEIDEFLHEFVALHDTHRFGPASPLFRVLQRGRGPALGLARRHPEFYRPPQIRTQRHLQLLLVAFAGKVRHGLLHHQLEYAIGMAPELGIAPQLLGAAG